MTLWVHSGPFIVHRIRRLPGKWLLGDYFHSCGRQRGPRVHPHCMRQSAHMRADSRGARLVLGCVFRGMQGPSAAFGLGRSIAK